ncbi:MAG: hypothetical protein GC179_22525 [Anaerolineaceae bacterium]|nr:hypothetical protein [Anaerolineaceae bacterium]
MPVTVDWDNPEQTTILITFHRPWTWKDFDASVAQMLQLFDTVSHQVNIIIDIREGGLPPPDAIPHFKRVAEIDHPNGGQLVLIAPTTVVRFINGIVRVMKLAFSGSGSFKAPKFIFTHSPEEAHAYLRNHQTTKAS